MATQEQIDQILENLASGIRRVTSDSGSTEMQSLSDQIAALKQLLSINASKSKNLGIRVKKVDLGNSLGES